MTLTPAHRSPTPKGLLRFGPPAGEVRRRLYCVPYAGGGPATYRLWARTLPADTEVVAVQIPGRDPSSGDQPVGSITGIVDGVHAAIDQLQADDPTPFALFGHSMGALIAFELTLVLESAGGPAPVRLFVSGRRPPDEASIKDPIHALPDDEFLDAIQSSYGAVPAAVRDEPELLALFLPSLRADIRALETYAPQPGRLVRGPVRVYGGADDANPGPRSSAAGSVPQRRTSRSASSRAVTSTSTTTVTT